MRFSKYLPPFVLIASVLGGLLRGINLITGYEVRTSLPIEGNLAQTALIILSIVMIIIVGALSRPYAQSNGKFFIDTFGTNSNIYKSLVVLAGACMGISGLLGLYTTISDTLLGTSISAASMNIYSELLPLLPLWILAILSLVSFLVLAKSQFSGEITESRAGLSIIPMFWACFDLIITFKDNSISPFVSLYAFELFAAVFLVFAFYVFAGFFYAKSNIALFMFFSSMSVFFCITCAIGWVIAMVCSTNVTFADDTVFRYLGFVGAAIYLAANMKICAQRSLPE